MDMQQVQELRIDYTHCYTDAPEGSTGSMPSKYISSHFKSNSNSSSTSAKVAQWGRQNVTVNYGPGVDVETIQCNIIFNIPDNLSPPVLFYYRLTNFYQNHRRYVKSFDMDQLQGTAVSNGTISSGDCDPLRLDHAGKAYYPCGLVANSVFNDTFSNPVLLNPQNTNAPNQTYTMQNNSGISWPSDKDLYGPTKYDPYAIAVPPNWVKRYPNGYTYEHPPPNLAEDEAFQVWMRTAGLPTFSKLAQRNDDDVMPSGTYQVNVNYRE